MFYCDAVTVMEIKPIAYIYTDFKEKFGLPRQSGRVPQLCGKIVFEPEYRNPDCIRGIEEFSHLWLIFGFSEAENGGISMTVRPPRLGGNERVGVFASRAPYRPNSLGLSCVALQSVEYDEKDGNVLYVSGIDMLNKTPIYDIKPYIPYCDAHPDAKGSYAEKNEKYCVDVDFPEELLCKIPKEKQTALIKCLGEDPRPSYHKDGRKYSMTFLDFDVCFTVTDGVLKVLGVGKNEH